MADTGGIRAGKAFVEAYLDKTKLTRGLKTISVDLKAFGAGVASLGTKFMALGAGIVTPLMGADAHFAKFGSELYDMSQRTGMGTNALSELGFAAEQSGASLGDVEVAVKRMQKAISAAKDGPLASLKGMAPEAQFEAMAESIAAIADPTERAAKAIEIFGRGGTALLPMLGDMKALRAEAVRLGLSVGPQEAAAADAIGDAWDKSKATFKAAAFAIGSALAPMLTTLAEKLATGVAAARKWIGENKPLIVSIFAAGVAAVATGAGLFVLGKGIVFIGWAFSTALAATKAAVATFGFLKAAVFLLANPFVLVGAAAVALAGYLLYTSGVAGKVGTWISGVFATLLSEVTSTFGQIAESMAAGDMVSAAKVGWALIKLEWQRGVSFITGIWEGFKGFWDEATSGLAIGLINASASVQSVWADMINRMSRMWADFSSSTFFETLADWMMPFVAAATGKRADEIEGMRKSMHEDAARQREANAKKAVVDSAAVAAQKEALEAQRKAAVDAIGGGIAGRNAARDAKVKAAQDAVDAARAEWDKAKTDAHAKAMEIADEEKKKKGDEEKKKKGKASPFDVDAVKSSVRGTFSASAATGLGAGGNPIAKAVNEHKKATDAGNKLLGKIQDVLEKLGLEAAA